MKVGDSEYPSLILERREKAFSVSSNSSEKSMCFVGALLQKFPLIPSAQFLP